MVVQNHFFKESAIKIGNALDKSSQLLLKKVQSVEVRGKRGAKWDLWLAKELPIIETCAISSGIISLIHANLPPDNDVVQQAVQTILYLQDDATGAWTSWIGDVEETRQEENDPPLVIDTFFAMWALRAAEKDYLPEYPNGIDWLKSLYDPIKKGWGFYSDQPPYTLPTALAIRTFYESENIDPTEEDKRIFQKGVQWLIGARNSDGGWGKTKNASSTLGHTAMALMALEASGYEKFDPIISKGIEWMLNTAHNDLRTQSMIPGTVDRYVIGNTRRITHVTFTPAVIIQAYIRNGGNLQDERLMEVINYLLEQQKMDGDFAGAWSVEGAIDDYPIFGIMDANVALKLYSNRILEIEPILELSSKFNVLSDEFNTISVQLKDMRQSIEQYSSQMNKIDTLLHSVDKLTEDLSYIKGSVDTLTPLVKLAIFLRKNYKFLILLFLAFIAYALAYYYQNSAYKLIPFTAGLILTVIGLIAGYVDFKKSD